ncbi:MAG: hemerythrin domain-containing protein [Acidimicrobiales bacterium]
MTITDPNPTTATALEPVAVDLYRDIHKGIRAELFAATESAGRLDPVDRAGRADLAHRVDDIVELLVSHAHHEDEHIQPALEQHLPARAEQIAADHERIDGRLEVLVELARTTDGDPRLRVHQLYLELASFTAAYLEHQDLEERIVMPALEGAVGIDACLAMNQAVVGSIPPEEMARSLALMLPAMNIDDRSELLGGMQAGAPAEVFEQVWGLTRSVLTAEDVAGLAHRLGRS